ncbi:hypothetical protein J2X46_003941 [Nocardioides sp. BE266]|uniref:hypothetical protein n=1 Tax=Nocardioides sp. BE266 TaxID=2817725 RepID=UPI002856618C|nr:hypothetical protein [Nocardioides sp. BE266]MDR7254939.1 hypothetical protein [Nocardioides sp. BE266]
MARVKGGLANLIPSVNDVQGTKPGEGPADTHLSVVTPPAAEADVPEQVATAPDPVQDVATAPTPAASKPKKPSSSVKKAPAAKKAAPARVEDDLVDESELPRYLQLERKDVRMRSDQLDSLTNLSRRLNKQRRGRGERITENTLVRVAIDLLMSQADELGGFTEDELRSSLGV